VTRNPARVTGVAPNSLAYRCGLRAGDTILTINGYSLRDVIDVQVYSGEPEINVHYVRADAERTCEAKRRYGESLGLDFEVALFDENTRVCQNNCDFCFVTQMAPGLRSPLYVKDDDYRLSFLHGNYVTLTNLREEDWNRIADQYLSPLYISVHVTDPDIRVGLMHNPRAANIMDQLLRLKQLGIEMHTQAVLVPGRNDGKVLDKTISDLAGLHPAVLSLSVVPVGLTRWHNPALRPYTDSEAKVVLEQVLGWRDKFRTRLGASFVYPADEWFLQADVVPPELGTYDGYIPVLVENGVGMVRRFMDSWSSLQTVLSEIGTKSQTWVTGELFAPTLSQYADRFTRETGIAVNVVPVNNRAYGETVTVAGLLTVRDIADALGSSPKSEVIILPDEIFRGPNNAAIDGLTVEVLAREMGRPIFLTTYERHGWKAQFVA
jgi:putative radical SAM enzyme (TIGR03279 family)